MKSLQASARLTGEITPSPNFETAWLKPVEVIIDGKIFTATIQGDSPNPITEDYILSRFLQTIGGVSSWKRVLPTAPASPEPQSQSSL